MCVCVCASVCLCVLVCVCMCVHVFVCVCVPVYVGGVSTFGPDHMSILGYFWEMAQNLEATPTHPPDLALSTSVLLGKYRDSQRKTPYPLEKNMSKTYSKLDIHKHTHTNTHT